MSEDQAELDEAMRALAGKASCPKCGRVTTHDSKSKESDGVAFHAHPCYCRLTEAEWRALRFALGWEAP